MKTIAIAVLSTFGLSRGIAMAQGVVAVDKPQRTALEQLGGMAPQAALEIPKPLVLAPVPVACVGSPRGTYSLCELRARALACPVSPFANAYQDLIRMDPIDPRIMLNIAKSGLSVRFDQEEINFHPGAAALYDPLEKVVILDERGDSALYEFAHAVDDALAADNWFRFFKGLGLARESSDEKGEGLLKELSVLRTGVGAVFFRTAGSLGFVEAYEEYVKNIRAGGVKMSGSDDDITDLVENYMNAFVWYAYPIDRARLARDHPRLHDWVASSLRELSEMDELTLFSRRFANPRQWPPGYDPKAAMLARGRLIAGMEARLRRGELPAFQNLGQYCGSGSDPFDLHALFKELP